MAPLRIVFAGTPEFAARHLQSLLNGPHPVVAVYTQPDRRAGRGKRLQPSPVKVLAERHNLPVRQPSTLKDSQVQQELAGFNADLLVVVAYGLILPQAVLDIPRYGCINVHASLLPRWRGAAPVERAILAGDERTGVTIMQMDAGLDTGDMLIQRSVPIEDIDTGPSLTAKLAEAGTLALRETLDNYAALREQAQPQDDALSTYAGKLSKEEALIDWQASASHIDRQIRANVGRSPAYTLVDGERIRILEAVVDGRQNSGPPGEILDLSRGGMRVACGEGRLHVQRVQLPGKKPVTIADLINAGNHLLAPGRRLGGLKQPKHSHDG